MRGLKTRQSIRSERGSAFAETILVFIAFLVFVSFVVDSYHFFSTQAFLTEAAREGAVSAANAPPSRDNLVFSNQATNPTYCDHYRCVDQYMLNNPRFCGSIIAEYRIADMLDSGAISIRPNTLQIRATKDSAHNIKLTIHGDYDNETPVFTGRIFRIEEVARYVGDKTGDRINGAWAEHNAMRQMVNSWEESFSWSNQRWGQNTNVIGADARAVVDKIMTDAHAFKIEFARFETWRTIHIGNLPTRQECPSPEFAWVDEAYATYFHWFRGAFSPRAFDNVDDFNCFVHGLNCPIQEGDHPAPPEPAPEQNGGNNQNAGNGGNNQNQGNNGAID